MRKDKPKTGREMVKALTENGFIGAWKDRTDIGDTVAFARRLRREAWRRARDQEGDRGNDDPRDEKGEHRERSHVALPVSVIQAGRRGRRADARQKELRLPSMHAPRHAG